MFGSSNPFGQSSISPFGTQTQSVFGQSNNASSNNPFGTFSPFGSQTGSSMFGGTSTGVFGVAQTASPFGSSSQSFGSSSPSPFGGTSTFGQKPFGFSTPQSSPFGSTTQQSQPAFGNNTFGSSTPFGASTTAAFGVTNTPAFGVPSTPAFGSTSTTAFGATTTPAFGAPSAPSFGVSPTPAFSSSAFGNNAFGASSTPAFGTSSSPSFSFSSSSAFGQSTSAFGISPFGSSSPFGSQGAQASTQTFGNQSPFGSQQVGSRATPYAPTTVADSGTQSAVKLQSISAMDFYKDKRHEELRWENYQSGVKGGQPPARSPGGAGFNVTNSQPSVFPQPTTFGQPPTNSTNFFSSPTAPNPFAQKTPTPTTNAPSPFGPAATQSMFGSTSSMNTSVFGPSTTVQPFGSTNAPLFSTSPSIFNSSPAQGSTPAVNSAANFSQPSPLFSKNPLPAQNVNPGFTQTSNIGTGLGNMFSNSPSLNTSSPFSQATGLTSFPSTQQAQPPVSSGFNNFSQTQTGGMSFSQGNLGQMSAPANSAVMQPITVTNPFGTLPALPQITIAQGGNSPSIQYGISSIPVVDRPAPVRVSSPLTSRHLLQRRIRQPARKYRPGDDGPKVPFFSDEENSSTPKADALFIPRKNPRTLFIRPVEKVKSALPKGGLTPLQENGKSSNGVTNGANHEDKDTSEVCDAPPVKLNHKPNVAREVNHRRDVNDTQTHSKPKGADIDSLMPKLNHAEYFTEPRIQELAAKERANPGYCRRVKDFVVGRHGYGSIKFLGETDVRKLDLETTVQFNNREVIVYMDESKKPPVGEGLNKPAEVTLLNIKCMEKTGKQVKEGPRVEKYKGMLKRKADEQGAQFVSWDAENGEWKFKVEHFSSYKLGDEDE